MKLKSNALNSWLAAFRWVMALAALCGILIRQSLAATAGELDKVRPNILWLIGDDLGPHLGCDGVKEVWTPNLDGLAAKGVRYTRCFTTAPVCSPSRSAFMTGMYQTTINTQNHRSHRDDGFVLPAGVRILPDWFRDGGYFTANIRELPAALGFSGTGKTDWNFTYAGNPFDSSDWNELKSHQPFFAQINFNEPHRPFSAPKRADPAKVKLPLWTPDHPVARADWAAYLDSVTELDRKVGAVLAQLKADGLAENTIIVFMGDNGMAHFRGKQFCYDSGLNVPLLIYVPDALKRPNGFRPGRVNRQLIEAIDVGPTLMKLAGIAKPAGMQGRVFLGERADAPRKYTFGARDRCDETVFRFRTVRDERYRYIRNFTPDRPLLQHNAYKERAYPVWNLLRELNAEGKLTPEQAALCAPTMPAEELFDLKSDPDEVHNLAASPRHQKVLQRLRAVLEQWISETNDQGREFEPAAVAARKGLTRPASTNAPPAKAE